MNIIFFSETKLLNYYTIGEKIKNKYTYDFFNKKILNNIIKQIKGDKPVIICSYCKTSYGSLLYVNELQKIIKNKIILLLFSPIVTLNKDYYVNKPIFKQKKHSIHKAFNNYKLEEDECIQNVFKNKNIIKYIFIS